MKSKQKKIEKVLQGTEVGVGIEGPPLKIKAWAKKDLPGHVRKAEKDHEPPGIKAAERGR